MEYEASKLIKKLISCCCIEKNLFKARIINQNEREELSFYLALQLIRTEKYREIIENNTNGFLSKMKYFVNKHYKNNNTAPIEEYDYKINSKTFHLSILCDIDYIVEMSKFIADSCWIFYNNKTSIPYITSDNPVCRVPRINENNKLITNDIGNIVSVDGVLKLTEFFFKRRNLDFRVSSLTKYMLNQ